MKSIRSIIGQPGKEWVAEIRSKPTADAIRSAHFDQAERVPIALGDLESVQLRVDQLEEDDATGERKMTIEGVAVVQTGMWWWKQNHILRIKIILYPNIPLESGRSLATIFHSGIGE